MKKLLSVILSCSMLLMAMPIVNAQENMPLDVLYYQYQNMNLSESDMEIVINNINGYKDDKMFLEHYQKDPAGAVENVRRAIERDFQINNNTMSTYATYLEASGVPMLKQATTYWCGSASALQTIYGNGFGSSVPMQDYANLTTKLDKQQAYIAIKDTNNEKNGEMIVYEVSNVINKYVDYPYMYRNTKTITSISQFRNYIKGNIEYNHPLILHAKTEELPYYNGKSSGHYITIIGINLATDMVILNDCHYNDTYNGIHAVPIEDVLNSISYEENEEPERYLIY